MGHAGTGAETNSRKSVLGPSMKMGPSGFGLPEMHPGGPMAAKPLECSGNAMDRKGYLFGHRQACVPLHEQEPEDLQDHAPADEPRSRS